MKPNKPDAQWEPVGYSWTYAIQNLGAVYDLRLVADDGKETIREKQVLTAAPTPLLRPAGGDPNALFEAWWTTNGPAYGDENKATVRDVVFAGYAAR